MSTLCCMKEKLYFEKLLKSDHKEGEAEKRSPFQLTMEIDSFQTILTDNFIFFTFSQHFI